MNIINQAGQHGVIYGDRGVGKTSLARVMAAFIEDQAEIAYYTCSSDDQYATIWPRVLDEMPVTASRRRPGFGDQVDERHVTGRSLLGVDDVSPDGVRRALGALASEDLPVVIFIDEFDRVQDGDTRRLFADTIKILSDHVTPATVILLGVGDTINDLIFEHASIQRSLVQVQMPRMATEELADIVRSGAGAAEMAVSTGFVEEVARLSQGMPHYTHLIAQHAASFAVEQGRTEIVDGDLQPAITSALEHVSQTQRTTYHDATFSNRATLYKEVLLACALAERDDLGFFGAPAVRDQLQRITGRSLDIPAFAAHLKDFSSLGPRGEVLQKAGSRGGFKYRFIDPLLPPYILMRGRVEGLTPTATRPRRLSTSSQVS